MIFRLQSLSESISITITSITVYVIETYLSHGIDYMIVSGYVMLAISEYMLSHDIAAMLFIWLFQPL